MELSLANCFSLNSFLFTAIFDLVFEFSMHDYTGEITENISLVGNFIYSFF